MCLAVKICPGSYSVSVLECADVGERKGREEGLEGEAGGGWRVEGGGQLFGSQNLLIIIRHIV